MQWYEFNQNNSGGSFVVDDRLCHRVFIEADSVEAATDKALSLGVYFDGARDGRDCPCCGDRWSEPYRGITFPYRYSDELTFTSVRAYAQYLADTYGWTDPDARLYYATGHVSAVRMVRRRERS